MESAGFPSTLRTLRKRSLLRQDELAAKVGVSVDTIRRWEAGEREPRLSDLHRIAEVLGVTLGELLDYEDTVDDTKVGESAADASETKDMIVFEWSDGAGGTMRMVLPPTPESYEFLQRKTSGLPGGEQSSEALRNTGGSAASA